jgi:hypothetical protein
MNPEVQEAIPKLLERGILFANGGRILLWVNARAGFTPCGNTVKMKQLFHMGSLGSA